MRVLFLSFKKKGEKSKGIKKEEEELSNQAICAVRILRSILFILSSFIIIIIILWLVHTCILYFLHTHDGVVA
jgi:hypothetical protein